MYIVSLITQVLRRSLKVLFPLIFAIYREKDILLGNLFYFIFHYFLLITDMFFIIKLFIELIIILKYKCTRMIRHIYIFFSLHFSFPFSRLNHEFLLEITSCVYLMCALGSDKLMIRGWVGFYQSIRLFLRDKIGPKLFFAICFRYMVF